MLVTMLRFIFKTLFSITIVNQGNPLTDGKKLIIANHESFLDGLLLGLFLPVKATFVVHTGVLKVPFFRAILSFVPHLAVDPTSPLAMKKVIKLLEEGKPVVIFPEGRLTVTGSLMKVYDGPGFVAAKTGAEVVPVRLDGPSRSMFSRMSGNYPKKWFPKITLTVLPSTRVSISEEGTAKVRRRKAGDAMRRVMQEMMFKSQPVQTLFTAFLDAMETHGRGYKLLEDIKQDEESYSQLLKKSLALGKIVSKISVQGDALGVLLPNTSATVCTILGMSAFGRIPAMLNYTAGEQGIKNACIAANVKTILTSREFVKQAKLEDVIVGLAGSLNIQYLEDLKHLFGTADKVWLMGWAVWCPRSIMANVKPEDTAVILFTSGSEGKPKGVVLSHASVLSNIAQIRSVIDFSPSDKFMVALPLFHAFGFTCGGIMPLVTGSKIFLYPSPLHYRIIPEIIYDRGCTVLFGTSTFLGNYAKYANPYDFYKLRYVVAGAEKLNPDVRSLWNSKFGIRILEGYGSTECSPVISVNTPMAHKEGSVGVLLPGMRYSLELLQVQGWEKGGILHVAGPNVMKGYYLYDNPGVLVPPGKNGDGWYSTGDVVEVDPDGFIHILGRVKRFAKVAGEMVSLETVEQIARLASPEFNHAASTQTDPQRGESLVLFTTNANLTRQDLVAAAQQSKLPEIAVARKVVYIKEIPLLGTGKTDYVSLKQLAEEV